MIIRRKTDVGLVVLSILLGFQVEAFVHIRLARSDFDSGISLQDLMKSVSAEKIEEFLFSLPVTLFWLLSVMSVTKGFSLLKTLFLVGSKSNVVGTVENSAGSRIFKGAKLVGFSDVRRAPTCCATKSRSMMSRCRTDLERLYSRHCLVCVPSVRNE